MGNSRFNIEQLSEGFFEIFTDGTIHKKDPTQLEKLKKNPVTGQQSAPIGIDPLYVTNGEIHLLLDTGLGWGLDYGSRYKHNSNIVTNLDIFGVKAEDIQFVILSHLHYDHVAGSTFVNNDFRTTATFPNAEYLVQKREWDYAVSDQHQQSSLLGATYKMDELYKLAAENRLHFVDQDIFELVPGIKLLFTGGHTPGHQIVQIRDEGRTIYFPGDLIPADFHLNQYAMKQMDFDPVQAKKYKTLLLKEAFNTGAFIYFYHSLFNKNGKIARDQHKKYVLLDGS
jgi:glyoxylase-like metal-dependent hydrolase (beta-lactamase superfamily II)